MAQTGHIAYETHFAETATAEVYASIEDNGTGVFQVFNVRERPSSSTSSGSRLVDLGDAGRFF